MRTTTRRWRSRSTEPRAYPPRADRHRRRVQHGRRHRAAARPLRGGRAVRWSVLMVDDAHGEGVLGKRRARHRGSLRPARQGGHRSGHAVEGVRRGGRRCGWQRESSSTGCASAAARSCSPRPSPRRTRRPASRRSICWKTPTALVDRLWENAQLLQSRDEDARFRHRPSPRRRSRR